MARDTLTNDLELYDKLLSAATICSNTRCPIKARLLLCHPTSPDVVVALEAIKKREARFPSKMHQAEKSGFILLCLKSAEYLLNRDQLSEAQPIIDIVQGHLECRQNSRPLPEKGGNISLWPVAATEGPLGG